MGGFDLELMHEGEDGGGFQGAAVVAVKDGGIFLRGEFFAEVSALDEDPRVVGIFFCEDF